jgi:hypothetical protein
MRDARERASDDQAGRRQNGERAFDAARSPSC